MAPSEQFMRQHYGASGYVNPKQDTMMTNPITAIKEAVQQLDSLPGQIKAVVVDIESIKAMAEDLHQRIAAIENTFSRIKSTLHLGD